MEESAYADDVGAIFRLLTSSYTAPARVTSRSGLPFRTPGWSRLTANFLPSLPATAYCSWQYLYLRIGGFWWGELRNPTEH